MGFFPKYFKIRNRNSHVKLFKIIVFFWNKKVFTADSYFVENSTLLRNHVSSFPAPYCHQSVTRNVDEVSLWIQYEIFWRYLLLFHSCRPLYCDHNKFGKSTSRFSQTFKKTLIIQSIFVENFVRQFCLMKFLNLASIFCASKSE